MPALSALPPFHTRMPASACAPAPDLDVKACLVVACMKLVARSVEDNNNLRLEGHEARAIIIQNLT